MITHNLFPTAVSFFEFGSDLTQDELDFITSQPTRGNDGNATSTDHNLFDHLELARIAEFCNQSVLEYFHEIYNPKNQVTPYITQSWANYTEQGQYHHKHAHPNSFISGVFYVKTTPDLDRIYFYQDNYRQIKLPPKEWNLYNSESWWLPATTGQLILFPSSLTHMVQPVEAAETRISISFNTWLKGDIGDDQELTGLHL